MTLSYRFFLWLFSFSLRLEPCTLFLEPCTFPLAPYKGWVKAENFRQSPHKIKYFYKLTPHGLEEKARVTARFLKQKLQEYEEINAEIEELRKETGQ